MTAARLHHTVRGSGPDLVLLHGGAGSLEDLADLGDRLAQRHRVIAPDQRLHGRSPDPGDISYALMASDTAALLDELGVRDADLVGWSDGGVVALFVARDRPDLVRRVVAIGANVDWPPDRQDVVLTERAQEFFAAMWGAPASMPMPDAYRESPDGPGHWPVVMAKLVEMWRQPPGITLEDLGSIRAPVLFLAGETDIVRVEHTLAMRGAVAAGALSIMPGAGHGLPQQEPDLVARLVERFLAEPTS